MRQCQCGSYALNPDRGDPDRVLCDVCYWRGQALAARDAAKQIVSALPTVEIRVELDLIIAWAVETWPWLEEQKETA